MYSGWDFNFFPYTVTHTHRSSKIRGTVDWYHASVWYSRGGLSYVCGMVTLDSSQKKLESAKFKNQSARVER